MQILPLRKYEFVESFNDLYVNQQQKGFSVITGNNFLPSFIYKLSTGFYIDSLSDFDIKIYDNYNELVFQINSQEVIHKVYKNGTSWYYMYNGDQTQCLDLGCGFYYMKIGEYYSDWFKVVSDLSLLTRIVAKSKYNTKEVPYSLGFQQTLYLENRLLEPELISNTISDIDSTGKETVSSVIYRNNYKLNLYNLPASVSHFLQHLESCTDVTVYFLSKEISVMKNQFKCKSTRDTIDIGTFNSEISFTESVTEKINFCENTLFEVVSEVKVPEISECFEYNPIESIDIDCEVEENYHATVLVLY